MGGVGVAADAVPQQPGFPIDLDRLAAVLVVKSREHEDHQQPSVLQDVDPPAGEQGDRDRESLLVLAGESGVQEAVSAITGIVTIAIIVIVWAPFALHRLDILSAVSRTP